jgi:hypothetical protein
MGIQNHVIIHDGKTRAVANDLTGREEGALQPFAEPVFGSCVVAQTPGHFA